MYLPPPLKYPSYVLILVHSISHDRSKLNVFLLNNQKRIRFIFKLFDWVSTVCEYRPALLANVSGQWQSLLFLLRFTNYALHLFPYAIWKKTAIFVPP